MLKATLGGHRANKIYGRLDCAGAASWIARGKYVDQRVFFCDEAMAIAAGFRPCGGCMRERYRQWKSGELSGESPRPEARSQPPD